MFGFTGLGFVEMWSPVTILVVLALICLYLYVTGPGRERWFKDSSPVPVTRKAWFIVGLVLLYGAWGSPIDLLGHMMFTFHMVSMALAYFFAPPMLLAGIPEWMLRPIGNIPGIRKLKFIINPIFALVFFNITFSVYHFPGIHDFVMTNYAVHTIYYAVLLFAAILMWFPIICPIRSLDRLEGFRKMGYIFATSVLLMPACALIIFADAPMYRTYTDPNLWVIAMGYCLPQASSAVLLEMFSGPQSLSWMEPLKDQQIGGVVMKLVQEVVYGSVLVYTFRQWYRRENPKQAEQVSFEPSPAYLEQLRLSAESARQS